MKIDKHDHLIDRMKGRLFVKSSDSIWFKDGKPQPRRRYSIQSLGYRSENTLKQVVDLKVGDSLKIYDYKLIRVE